MPTKKKAAGEKKTEDDGVRISKFSLVRSGPLRRAVNEAMDQLPHPKEIVPGRAKLEVEMLEDSQIRIEFEVGYRPEQRKPRTPAPAPTE
jgi:hypothetical protein